MNSPTQSHLHSMQDWLRLTICDERDLYSLQFHDQLIGNPLIRSVHGGVSASLIEMSAEYSLLAHLGAGAEISFVSSSVDYLRITKDSDVHARAKIVRASRRLGFVDVWCWQDSEDTPIARGTCTLRIMREADA